MSAENGAGLLKTAYADDPDSSEEWERIKGWVGSQEPVKKHPVKQIIEREQRKVPGFAEGGAVDDPNADLRLLEPPGAGIIAPSAALAPPPPITPAPAPAAPPPPAAAPPIPTAPVPAPSSAPYESAAAKTLGMDPAALEAYLNKTMRPTAGEAVGRVGATLGDALSRAGGSNANYLEQFNKNQQQTKENLAGIPEKVAARGKERFGLEHELETYDPNSPFSKVMQGANRELLKSMGATDADVAKLPASAINDIASHKVELKKALAEIELTGTYKAAELGFQQSQLKNTEAYQKAQQELEKQGKEQEAAKTLEARGPIKRATDFVTRNPATKLLERQAEGLTYAPDVTSYAAKHGITPEAAQAIKDKRTGGK